MARRLLTNKRQEWVRNRNVTLRGKPLTYNVSLQNRYAKRLDRLTRQMTAEVEREVKKLFRTQESKAFYAEDASLGSMARVVMNRLTLKYAKLFVKYSKPWAESMVSEQSKQSKRMLHSSLEKLSGGLSIKTGLVTAPLSDILKASVAENVDLIKSIPDKYMTDVQGAVMRSITNGSGGGLKELTENINSMLDKRSRQVLNKAKFIATDQTRKAYAAINRERMRAVGVGKYQWVHSGAGQKPRELHRDTLNGQIFSLDDPPVADERTGERAHPGTLPNCRCFMLPVIEFDEG